MTSASLDRLPTELLEAISSFLPNKDIKSLRLTSRAIKARVLLRLDRVFLSANPRNVDVFNAVAGHEDYRHRVREIVWDDARLPGAGSFAAVNLAARDGARRDARTRRRTRDGNNNNNNVARVEGVPDWFVAACHLSHRSLSMFKGRQIEDQPLRDSWRYYEQLLQQQEDVIASGADIAALRRGLARFAALRRVTLTCVSHGLLDSPSYETPMIRAFPHAFSYPVTRACWPLRADNGTSYQCGSWDSPEERDKWRGFSIITHELAAQKQQQIPEFVVDVAQLDTGLNSRLFDNPAASAYADFVAVLQRPGFRRLDLALLSDCPFYAGEEQRHMPFRAQNLKHALEQLQDPHHVSLRVHIGTNTNPDNNNTNNNDTTSNSSSASHYLPLQDIFPPLEKWEHLHHLGLSGMTVDIDEVLTLLRAAPPHALRTVDLSYLTFKNSPGQYYDLLEAIRHTLQWHKREPHQLRPRLTIHIPSLRPSTYLCLDHYVHEYLYADDNDKNNAVPNPFRGVPALGLGKGHVAEAVERHRSHRDYACPDGAELGIGAVVSSSSSSNKQRQRQRRAAAKGGTSSSSSSSSTAKSG